MGSLADPVHQRKRGFIGTIQVADDIFDHHDGSIDDHAEIQRAEGEQIR